ncbi:MAG: pyridoxal phosphate-dependent aminotransferase [Phaeodactylibacter sp.]|nr:pyridoxal phosphate-dependent aminotransferase [Phaeodactylibacter sp.]MCB9303992.1 pyridoxal phosphate-dependent aminotransferase [Lewinellaceae bacterium]
MSTASIRHLSQRIQQMEESATIKMAQLARDLAALGHDVISLSLGEPDFDTPSHIKEAAKKALDDGYTKYTPVPGLVELRKAIQEKFKRDNGLDFGLHQIVVSNGAKQSIANLALSLLDEGDEVIILSPYWVSYSEIVKLAGGVPVMVYAGIEQDYKATAAQVENAITDRTRLLLFSSPCNPTGSVYTYEELQAIADVIARHEGIYIISDEIYEYINFTDKHASIGAIPSVKDRTATVNGFSKGFAMTGWRLGYIGAPDWIADACSKMQGQFTSGATSFGQKAAAHALLSDMSPTYEMREAFRQRRDLVIELLSQIPGVKVNKPKGAFYIFPDISELFGKGTGEMTIRNADDFSEYLLHSAHVAVVSGSAFGADNCFRISYAASEKELREAIRRIGEAIRQLS